MTDLAVDILGPLRVSRAGAAVPLGAARQQALLTLLALHPSEAVAADRLVEELWDGAAPETAAKIVQIYVSELRKALGRDAIATRGGGYALELDAGADRRAPLRAARGGGRAPRGARALARPGAGGLPVRALGAGGGAAARGAARRWCWRSESRPISPPAATAALAGELEALVAEHPLRERLRGQQILALYRSGRQAEALAAYRDAPQRSRRGAGDRAQPAAAPPRAGDSRAGPLTRRGDARARAASAQERDRALGGVERGRTIRRRARPSSMPRWRRSSATAAASSGMPAASPASSGSRSCTRTTRCVPSGRPRSCARRGVLVATGEIVAAGGSLADAVRALRPPAAAGPGEVILDETDRAPRPDCAAVARRATRGASARARRCSVTRSRGSSATPPARSSPCSARPGSASRAWRRSSPPRSAGARPSSPDAARRTARGSRSVRWPRS